MSSKNLSTNLSTTRGQMDKIPDYKLKNSSWTWKRTGITDENGSFGRITAITVLSILLSTVCFMQDVDAKITTTFILTAISGILWDDPLNMLCHFLASNIRKLLSGLCLLWIPALWFTKDDYIIMAAVVTAIILALAYKTNKQMLFSDTWKYSASVQHGLNMASNSETEKAWQAWGSAECRSLYGYSGNDVDDQLISRYAKPVFFLVYHKIRDRFSDRIRERDLLNDELMAARERIQNLEKSLEASEQNLLEAKQQDDDSGIFLKQQEEIENMAKLCAKLTLANEELVEALSEREVETVHVPDERYLYLNPEERAKELLKMGDKTYREIAVITGLSKSKIGNIAKELEDEYE